MALQRIDPEALARAWRKRGKNEREARRMRRAVRWSLYLTPVAIIVASVLHYLR